MSKIRIFGEEIIDINAINQLKNCLGPDDIGVLTADSIRVTPTQLVGPLPTKIKSHYRVLGSISVAVTKR